MRFWRAGGLKPAGAKTAQPLPRLGQAFWVLMKCFLGCNFTPAAPGRQYSFLSSQGNLVPRLVANHLPVSTIVSLSLASLEFQGFSVSGRAAGWSALTVVR